VAKIYELLRKKQPTKGMFGIEIEVEGNGLPVEEHGHWTVDMNEGSLRDGGVEYVFDGPLDKDAALKEVKGLAEYIKDEGGDPVFSPRTSVHAHVNVSDLEFNHMCNFLFIAFLIEGNLSHYCGDVRKGNPFCITGKNAEGVYDALEVIYRQRKPIQLVNERIYRYGFINLMSLQKYGSVEFRGMYGTLDTEVLGTWMSMLEKIKTLAVQFETPVDLIKHIDDISLKTFMLELLPLEYIDFRYEGEMVDAVDAYDILRTITLPIKTWKDKEVVVGDNPFFAALEAGMVKVREAELPQPVEFF